jgi:hypothetical protein
MELESAALQLSISSLSDEALILLLKKKCDWSTRISQEKFSKDEEKKIVRKITIEPDNTGVFLYISYYFPEIARAIYQTFGHSYISCFTKEHKFVPDWTWKYSRSESFQFQIDEVTYWALIDYDFDEAIISPEDCIHGRELLCKKSRGINSKMCDPFSAKV